MSALDSLLTKWKLWINRDRTFNKDELKELQSHLMEEINYLVKREGLSEEEAFHQAVSLVGDREGLDQEFVKEKSVPGKVIHWGKTHPWQISFSLLLITFLLIFDSIFSVTHTTEYYETQGKYFYSSPMNNSYISMFPVSYIFNSKYVAFIIINKKVEFKNNKIAEASPKTYWGADNLNPMLTKPLFYCLPTIFTNKYFVVIDDKNQLWFSQTGKIERTSPHIEIQKSEKLKTISSSLLIDNNIIESPIFRDSFGYKTPDSLLIDFINLDNYSGILTQKDKEKIRTIRIQITNSTDNTCPILFWDEITLIKKPIHFLPFIFDRFIHCFTKKENVVYPIIHEVK